MAGIPGAPAKTRPQTAHAASDNGNAPARPMIPFTRAARKKSRQVGQYTFTPGAAVQQLAPIQIPANGYLRRIVLQVVCTTAGNAATVAFQNDAPFIALQQLQLSAANGDQLINAIDGFDLYSINKYGAHANEGNDPLTDPNYAKVTGAGGTGGSFTFTVEVPLEFDSRDGAGSLPNMAANQSFLLQLWGNTSAAIYSTAPTTLAAVTIKVFTEYYAAPAKTNPQNVPQATAPITNGLVPLIQTELPPIVPGTDQPIQLTNVGNTIRYWIFILRTAAGVRDETDWPSTVLMSVNNDVWRFMDKLEWRRRMARAYNYRAGLSASPTQNALDNGVFVWIDFMNDGASGDETVSGAANRDLMLVTGSATAVGFEFQNWGGSAGALKVITHSLKVPNPAAFYHPHGE